MTFDDARSPAERELYNKQQRQNREARQNYFQWKRYKERLGEDAPKSQLALERIKKKGGQEWEELQRKYRAAGVDKAGESGIIYGETICNGVGAKSSTYPVVYYPGTDVQVDFVIGSKPKYPSDHTMAGLNCKTHREIDDIDRLVDEYNCDARRWQKEKARYEVYDEYGEIREVELHWYQHPDVGKVEYKVKTKGGYVYVDEWD